MGCKANSLSVFLLLWLQEHTQNLCSVFHFGFIASEAISLLNTAIVIKAMNTGDEQKVTNKCKFLLEPLLHNKSEFTLLIFFHVSLLSTSPLIFFLKNITWTILPSWKHQFPPSSRIFAYSQGELFLLS